MRIPFIKVAGHLFSPFLIAAVEPLQICEYSDSATFMIYMKDKNFAEFELSTNYEEYLFFIKKLEDYDSED